jgi:hypothetical protein
MFLPKEHYLKIFVWVGKDIIYQNIHSKVAKIAYCCHHRRQKDRWKPDFLLQMQIKWF